MTDRHAVPRSESAWTASPDQMATALREAADAITIQDANGNLVFANWAAARTLGFASPEDVMRVSAREVLGNYWLFDASGDPFPADELPSRRALRGEESPETIVRFRDVGGTVDRWARVRATPVTNDDGQVQFVISSFQDLTALKRSEEQLRLLADAGAVLGRSENYLDTLRELARLLVPIVADWCVVDVIEPNSGMRRAAVAHSDAEMLKLAETTQRRYPPDPDQPGGIGDVLRTGRRQLYPAITDEQLASSARDEEHLALLRALDLKSVVLLPLIVRNEVLGVLTLIRGHNARPFGEGELPLLEELARRAGMAVDNARLLEEAKDAIRLRDDFLAMASHDMRTPLAAILGYLQLAERRAAGLDEPHAHKLGDYLTSAERMTQKLASLVSELMDVSLLQSGQPLPLLEDSIDVSGLVRSVVAPYRRLSPQHRLRVEARGGVFVIGDASRLERVLDNLIGNAVKYSPNGGRVLVSVTAHRGEARIAVRDYGMGIPAAELPRLFERFHRGSNVTALRGTGLGLSGSLEIIRQMGGEISVETAEGNGSTFTVRLPLATTSEAVGEAAAGASAEAPGGAHATA
jgi:PAS domain S-box-containing protein